MNLIDAHAHIGDFPGFVSGGERTADTLVETWDASGVDCGLISVLDPFDVQSANDRVRIACEAHPTRIYGYIYLHVPDVQGSLAELERCRDTPCFRAVKLHPANDAYFPFYEGYEPVYERIEELGLPILWHSGTYPYSHPFQIAAVARKTPRLDTYPSPLRDRGTLVGMCASRRPCSEHRGRHKHQPDHRRHERLHRSVRGGTASVGQ